VCSGQALFIASDEMTDVYQMTVGIATRNRFEDLTKCLQSVLWQTYMPREIIVIDDGNLTAKQVESCRKIAEPKIRFVYVKKDEPSVAASRNMIANLARGHLVLLLDDDTVLEHNYIENVLTVFIRDSNLKIAAVCGVILNLRSRSILGRIWRRAFFLDNGVPGGLTHTMFESKIVGIRNECRIQWLSGNNTMFRRDILLMHPFEEFFGGRTGLLDIEQALRIRKYGYTLIATPDAKLYHYRSGVERESAFMTGFKHAFNRSFIFKKYGQVSPILFLWSMLGYIVGLIVTRRVARALGTFSGLYHFAKKELFH
jgi:GT2 family glycosyltransferase